MTSETTAPPRADDRDGFDAAVSRNPPKACPRRIVPVVEGPQYSLAPWNGLGLVILDPQRGAVARAKTADNRSNTSEVADRVRPLYDRGEAPER